MLEKLYKIIAAGIIDELNQQIETSPITKIERLKLEPDDVIVLKSKNALSQAAYDHLTQSVKALFPEHEHTVIVLEEDMDIAVISNSNNG